MSTDLFDRYATLNPAETPEVLPDWTSVAPVLLAEIDERVHPLQTEHRPRTQTERKRRWTGIRVAATAFAAVLIVGGIMAVISDGGDPQPAAPVSTSATTPPPTTVLTSVSADPVQTGPVSIEVQNLTGHLGDGLSGLLQRYDPESGVDPASGLLTENVAAFAVAVDADPFSTTQVLRDIDPSYEEYSFAETWRYLEGEAAIPAGVYRLTVWAGADYCCFLYNTAPPEVPARRCQMWVTVTGEGQTIRVRELGLSGTHCNPDEPLQSLP